MNSNTAFVHNQKTMPLRPGSYDPIMGGTRLRQYCKSIKGVRHSNTTIEGEKDRLNHVGI